MQKKSTESQIWVPKLPKKFDLSHGAILTEAGVTKDAYEAFFAKQETSSYAGYKWDIMDNKVYILIHLTRVLLAPLTLFLLRSLFEADG